MEKMIKEYLNNNLSMTEEAAFEEKNIQEAFDFIERRTSWNNLIADTFANIEAETPQKPKISRFWYYGVAAIMALLLALGAWFALHQTDKPTKAQLPIQQGKNLDKNALVADASTRADKLLTMHNDGFESTIVRKKPDNAAAWQADFQLGNYLNVIRALEAIGPKRTLEDTYYLAEAYLKLNPKDTQKAQPLFKAVADTSNMYSKDALWAYALICLMHGDNDAAKTALDTLKIVSTAHSEDAQKLREALK